MNFSGSARVWVGLDVLTLRGPCLRPARLELWGPDRYATTSAAAPFLYRADALVGLSLLRLHPQLLHHPGAQHLDPSCIVPFWEGLEAHFELFRRGALRVTALRERLPAQGASNDGLREWEATFQESLTQARTPSGFRLDSLQRLEASFQTLEIKTGAPLLYDFRLQLQDSVRDQVHQLLSLLFHLRCLIGVHHNSQVGDPTYEGVQVDSILDYLPSPDFVANDAALYWLFLQQRPRLGASFDALDAHFQQLTHSAVQLVQHLPQSFLAGLPRNKLEDALYLAQTDWLLSSDAGLLYRLRTELAGALHGYEEVFWPGLSERPTQASQRLAINCGIEAKDVFASDDDGKHSQDVA